MPRRQSGRSSVSQPLLVIYDRLFAAYGPQHWWPADEPFEVMVGAILTQSASWKNVEKALANLKTAGALSPLALRHAELSELAALIRPSGYYNAKARKLKALAQWLEEFCADDLKKLSAASVTSLRQQLLSVYGVGPETADSIILYVANQPVFVIDAYTRRIISRIGIASEDKGYQAYRELFMENLPPDARLFNEYHALLVRLGKEVCRKKPLCPGCCLRHICQFGHRNGEEASPDSYLKA